MTAIVAFVAGDRAVLAADQAVWRPDGQIIRFESKLTYVPGARSVVAAQGVFSQELFRCLIETARDLRHLHDRILRFMDRNVAWSDGESEWPGYTGLMNVAGASWFEDGPVIWGMSQKFQNGPLEPMNLGTLWVSPNVDWSAAIGRPIHGREAVSTLGRDDALTIMEAQRLVIDHPPGCAVPIHMAGGGCDVAVVETSGITIDTLKLWPDVIGERISV